MRGLDRWGEDIPQTVQRSRKVVYGYIRVSTDHQTTEN